MRYKVVFTGKIAEGYILEKVKKNISEYFKLDYAEVENLFSGKPITVKNNADQRTALKIKTAMEKAGALCRILKAEKKKHKPLHGKAKAVAEHKTTGEDMITCPKCGFHQKKSEACLKCSIKTGTPVPQKSRVLTPAEKNKFQQARDLIAFYPFNGNANDESGNGNHGTVYGASLVKDRFGNADSAYSFDGVNDYIDIGRPLVSGGLYNQLLVEIKWPTKPVCRSDFTGQYVL